MNLKKRWLGKYSISFLCTCALVYFLQIFYGKSLVYMAGGGRRTGSTLQFPRLLWGMAEKHFKKYFCVTYVFYPGI